MAKEKAQRSQGGVHRVERAERQQQFLIFGAVTVLLIVAFLVIGGTVYESYFRPLQAAVTIGDEVITVKEFEARVRYERIQWVYRYSQALETWEMLADNPEFQGQVEQQLSQIANILEPVPFAERILNQLIDERIIRQEAIKRGITVTEAEIDLALQERYGYYADGTPTTAPTETLQVTSTLSSTQQSILTTTPTPSITPTLTPIIEVTSGISTATPTLEFTHTPEATPTSGIPTVTPTVITASLAADLLADELDVFAEAGFDMEEMRKLHMFDLYRQKLYDAITADFEREQEQVWVRHILVDVEDEEKALEVIARLADGEEWSALVEEYTINQTSIFTDGDLGWFQNSPQLPDYPQEFMDAAFALEIGEFSSPIETTSGWHVVQLLGKEVRQLSLNDINQGLQSLFLETISEARLALKIEIKEDNWKANVPKDPDVTQR